CGKQGAQQTSTSWPSSPSARAAWYSEPASPELGSSGTSAAMKIRSRSLVTNGSGRQEAARQGRPDAQADGIVAERLQQIAPRPGIAAIDQASPDEVGHGGRTAGGAGHAVAQPLGLRHQGRFVTARHPHVATGPGQAIELPLETRPRRADAGLANAEAVEHVRDPAQAAQMDEPEPEVAV